MSTEIELGRGFVAIVDLDDLERLQQYKWHSARGGRGGVKVYAAATHRNSEGKKRALYMHRFILNAPKGSEIDHINGNSLDNRKCNLRFCSRSENMQNVLPYKPRVGSRFLGVVPHGSRWKARAGHNGRTVYIGLYRTEEEARYAYVTFMAKAAGEFADRKLSMTQVPPAGAMTVTVLSKSSDDSLSVT